MADEKFAESTGPPLRDAAFTIGGPAEPHDANGPAEGRNRRLSQTAATRLVHANAPAKNTAFPNNRISNTKYTWYNFLFKNLLEQFSLHINRYFLFIAILQLFPVLTPVNPLSTWGPLLVIFAITATKEAIDDIGRAREDRKANTRLFRVHRHGAAQQQPSTITSEEICVGDVVFLEDGDEIPCDMVLLLSSTPNGSAYIQTVNLDGENTLKLRQAVAPRVSGSTVSAAGTGRGGSANNSRSQLSTTPVVGADDEERCAWSQRDAATFGGVIECAEPNADVYKFDSNLWFQPSDGTGKPRGDSVPLTGTNFLQQATSLANTDWIYGVVVYTGNQTKFGMNKGDPPFKYTKVDSFINMVAVVIFIFQLLIVIIFGIVGDVWRFRRTSDLFYLRQTTDGDWYEFAIIPLRFLLLNSTMIPISLKVTLDLCKLLYARFINADATMRAAGPDGEGAHARNTSISEDLGQIQYVLTDKTGTLTQNEMVFKQCSIAGQLYLSDADCGPDGRLTKAVADESSQERSMMMAFALNNTVVPVNKDGTLTYRASSPDELSLVKAAASLGVKLVSREGRSVKLEVNGSLQQFAVQETLEFTSDRKRMSVAILPVAGGKRGGSERIRLYIKGADDVILRRLRADQANKARAIMQQLEVMASQGLRTLVFAYREIDAAEFTPWLAKLKAANMQVGDEREAAVSEVYEMLEHDFEIQGCTAIEDRLQEQVPETIKRLREAGVCFWMLTGDKFTTALEIATACNLQSANPQRTLLMEVQGKGKDELIVNVDENLRKSYAELKAPAPRRELVVIIRGTTLQLGLLYYRTRLRELCLMANSVICCRVTPAQKAELVQLVRDTNQMTLAIGDGGNDVAMIQRAHVGVGIRGKEGLQASRAADYAINRFKDLERLMLIHGRYSYLRTALVAQYSFYKSFVFCTVQICFGTISFFSGSTLFNSLCITAYNAVLFVPIVTFVLERDISFKRVLNNPWCYRECSAGLPFTPRSMLQWNLRGAWQGVAIFLITVLAFGVKYHQAGSGQTEDWESLGIVAFCGYLLVQSVTMCLELRSINQWQLLAIWGMHGITLLILIFTNAVVAFDSFNGYWIVFHALGDGQTWLANFLMLVVCVVPVLAYKFYSFQWKPSEVDKLRFDEMWQANDGRPCGCWRRCLRHSNRQQQVSPEVIVTERQQLVSTRSNSSSPSSALSDRKLS